MAVGFKDSDELSDFEFKLGIDGWSIVECIEAADGFEATGGDGNFGGTKISGGAFEGMRHALDGDRVGIGQRRSDIREHDLVTIEEQADELSE